MGSDTQPSAADDPGAGNGNERHGLRLPGLEADGGACGDVEASAVCGGAIEFERAVRFAEVVVAADLDRAIAAIRDAEPDRGAPGVELDLAFARQDRTRRPRERRCGRPDRTLAARRGLEKASIQRQSTIAGVGDI